MLDVGWLDGLKALLTAVVVMVVAEVQTFDDRLSALLVSLPLVSLLAMMWMKVEGQGAGRLANHAEATFWFVLATLPMFVTLAWMLRHGWNFWGALGLCCLLTAGCFRGLVAVLRRCGLDLLG